MNRPAKGDEPSVVSHYAYSRGYVAFVFALASASAVWAAFGLVLLLRFWWVDSIALVGLWANPILFGVMAIIWFAAFLNAKRRYFITLCHDRIRMECPKSGEGEPKSEMLFDHLAGMTRPGSPTAIIFTSKDGEQVHVPASRLSANDFADLIARLRVVMAGRFTIPEDW